MSERPWYKRYGSDFITGTIGMTLEEKGAYSILLDLIYDRQGPVPDEPRTIAGICGCSVRKWNTIRARLIDLGKIYAHDGMISNKRADKEVKKGAKERRERSESGVKGAQKREKNKVDNNQNNNLAEKQLKHSQKPEARSQIPDTRSSNSIVPTVSPRAREGPALGEMLDAMLEAGGPALDRVNRHQWQELDRPLRWLEEGCDLWLDVIPTIRRLAARASPGQISSWKYFEKAVAQARADRETPFPKVIPHERSHRARQPSGASSDLAVLRRMYDECDGD